MSIANSDYSIICASADIRPGIVPILDGFARLGILERFVTTLGLRANGLVRRCLTRCPGRAGEALERLASRRILPEKFEEKAETYPWRELIRTSVRRWSHDEILSDRVWWWAERGFDRWVARKHAGRVPFVYGFEMASAETFRIQKQRGGWCVLGQLSAHHRTTFELMRQEMEQFPDAVTEYDRHRMRLAPRNNGLKDEQYALADLIVANSLFVRQSFVDAGITSEKIVVVPGAAPAVPVNGTRKTGSRTVFLAAGAQSIQKGTPYLLKAWQMLRPGGGAELRMVGKCLLPQRLVGTLPPGASMKPAVSHAEMSGIYRQTSVLVLPTLFEGFALVILEAMAHGLPVITTPNSGCGDFVENGINGWVVPIRDPHALADRMAWCLDNRDALEAMGEMSRQKAARWNWDEFAGVHGRTVLSFMKRVI